MDRRTEFSPPAIGSGPVMRSNSGRVLIKPEDDGPGLGRLAINEFRLDPPGFCPVLLFTYPDGTFTARRAAVEMGIIECPDDWFFCYGLSEDGSTAQVRIRVVDVGLLETDWFLFVENVFASPKDPASMDYRIFNAMTGHHDDGEGQGWVGFVNPAALPCLIVEGTESSSTGE